MVPDYDDDDIIEDYEEISGNSSARRVSSGQGGPVRRPSNGVRPSTTAMPAVTDDGNPEDQFGPPKGKISQKSAKLIWIICIAIVVLGLGLVVADYKFDFFDRNTGPAPAPNNAGAANTTRRPPPREQLSEEEQMQLDFKKAVIGMMSEMDKSKAWDFYWTSVLEYDHAYDEMIAAKNKEGIADEELEGAYAEAIKSYYKAKYAAELFREHFNVDNIKKEYIPVNISSDEVSMLNAEDLQNPKIQKYQAAVSKIDSRSTNVNKFKTDILKSELRAQRVAESEEWKTKVFGEWEKRWHDCTANTPPVFAQEDLDFVNGPDYKAGEKKMFEKFHDEHGGG